MPNSPDLSATGITGVGVVSAVGQGRQEFAAGLLEGKHAFRIMQRPGRQKDSQFLGAEIEELHLPERFSQRHLRNTSLSGRAALVVLDEAWCDANLNDVDPARIGLIVGGSNFQQRELVQVQESYAGRAAFVRPTYAISFMDTDLCGLCTSLFGITGFACTVGGASASGQLAILQAVQAVQSGHVEICIALGALMDLSYWECCGFRAVGAMGSDRFAARPESACRPFDRERDGFIFGEACGAVVVEALDRIQRNNVRPYASITGSAVVLDANRNPDPSPDGEMRVIGQALHRAGLRPQDIDYINPHGTGSRRGDEVECAAIRACGLSHAFINTTKSITGHGLTAAGAIEAIATLLQMRQGKLHPCRNLEAPISSDCNWVFHSPDHAIRNALSLSLGFGGINTALCLRALDFNKVAEEVPRG